MDSFKVLFVIVGLIAYITGVIGYDAGFGNFNNGPFQPYNFGYDARDEFGNSHYRQEYGDAGGVRGSYGYVDRQGLRRVVDYIANAAGFQATVKTNEPGTDGKENPAHVNMIANPIHGTWG
ncbi:cuticle protein 16.8 [Trichonephila clavata]|uniref:Cuticle protein 16.8 n=1 Tax=Trichonephila clavata TaxID=2740835 RepID=A0A8X6KQX7_TRICU|nr:cuticle protein 16.8 [Trichonephila clavata]